MTSLLITADTGFIGSHTALLLRCEPQRFASAAGGYAGAGPAHKPIACRYRRRWLGLTERQSPRLCQGGRS